MKAKYGLRAMSVLAREYGHGPVLIADLAVQERIPRKFLETILLELKKKGLLLSKKGKGGGKKGEGGGMGGPPGAMGGPPGGGGKGMGSPQK